MSEIFRRLGAFGRPFDASAQGWRGDEIFGWVTIVILLITAIVLGQLVLVVLRSRHQTLPSASRGDDMRSRLLVAMATLLVFLAVDGVALLRGTPDLAALLRRPRDEDRPILVEVLAQQWAWSFRLAGNDGRFGTDDDIVSLHELRLPVGRAALLELRSKDVIHSLYLPAFRVKRDAQPGVTTELLLEPTTAGRYEIACAQHCGINHYKMRGMLEVLDEEAWTRWTRDESALALSRAAARPSDANWAWVFGGREP